MTSSKPNYLPKAPVPNTITLGVRASTQEFSGGTQMQSIVAVTVSVAPSAFRGLSGSAVLVLLHVHVTDSRVSLGDPGLGAPTGR